MAAEASLGFRLPRDLVRFTWKSAKGGRDFRQHLRRNAIGVTVYVNGDPVNLVDPTGHDPWWQDSPSYEQVHPKTAPGTYDPARDPNAGCASCVNAEIATHWHPTGAKNEHPPAALNSIGLTCVVRTSAHVPCSQVWADTPETQSYCKNYFGQYGGAGSPTGGYCLDIGSVFGGDDFTPDSHAFKDYAYCLQSVLAGGPCRAEPKEASAGEMILTALALVPTSDLLDAIGGGIDLLRGARAAKAADSVTDLDIIARAAQKWSAWTGKGKAVLEVDANAADAQGFFDRLAQEYPDVTPNGYPGNMVELPGGGRVGLRLVSKSGPPTIDFNVPDLLWSEVKFNG